MPRTAGPDRAGFGTTEGAPPLVMVVFRAEVRGVLASASPCEKTSTIIYSRHHLFAGRRYNRTSRVSQPREQDRLSLSLSLLYLSRVVYKFLPPAQPSGSQLVTKSFQGTAFADTLTPPNRPETTSGTKSAQSA